MKVPEPVFIRNHGFEGASREIAAVSSVPQPFGDVIRDLHGQLHSSTLPVRPAAVNRDKLPRNDPGPYGQSQLSKK
jgi:hypothetical protein